MQGKVVDNNVSEDALAHWGQVAAYLMQVERSESWTPTARTFTEWVKAFAKRRGCTPTLLWRYKSAGRFYQERRTLLAKQGVTLPSLKSMSPAVSAEAVEILAKLMRVAPADVIEQVEVRTLKGEMPKKDVRAMWDVYSPLLEGKTARGRGVVAPTASATTASRAEADVLLGLKRSEGTWLGEKQAMFEVYLADDVASEVKRTGYYGCDILIVSRTDRESPVVIHGIEVKVATGRFPEFKDRAVEWLSENVDQGWLATPNELKKSDLARIPEKIGVMRVDPTGITVLRRPAPFERPRSAPEMLARDLLARSLRWWK